MDMRKIQSSGGASFTLTLPKEWIRAQGINKNDTVGVISQNDGTLVVTPKATEVARLEKKMVSVDSIKGHEGLFRLLISTYIAGYREIEITSTEKMTSQKREVVARFLNRTVGLETFEETENKILIHDLLDPTEMPFDKTIHRMYFLVKNMHEDAITGIINKDEELLQNVTTADQEIDRLCWLLLRKFNIVSNQATWLTKLDISQDEASFYGDIGPILEVLADYGTWIAQNGMRLGQEGLGDMENEIISASKSSMELIKKSLDTWFKKDIDAANEVMNSSDDAIKKCNELDEKFLKTGKNQNIAIGRIIQGIKNSTGCSRQIAELSLDYLIREN